jgi:ATP-dependent helicase/DNAse subunit B
LAVRFCAAPSNQRLWQELTDRFLGQLGTSVGPSSHSAFVWFTHRIQRDAIYIEAASRGLPGWLAPPIAFFSDLPELFGISQKRIGLLRRRVLIGQLAREQSSECGIGGALAERSGIVSGLDSLFGELLPEGVTPEQLNSALEGLDGDDFSRCRNAWIAGVFRTYLETLAGDGLYDPRQIHSLVADQIADDRLPDVLRGAEKLHVHGLTSRRTRRKLIDAFAAQTDIDVTLYVSTGFVDRLEANEFGAVVEVLEGEPPADVIVQPVPDGRREFEWVACRVKELLAANTCAPNEIAVVARTGRDDTQRAHEILNAAGVPNTARIRSPLAEIPALKAVLALFRAAARGWTYRPLRSVLASSYFDVDIDLRSIDYLARKRRVAGLDRWSIQLCRLQELVTTAENDWEYKREGLYSDRLDRDCKAFDEFRRQVEWLDDARPLRSWVTLTRRMLKPGIFGFRSRICYEHGERWEVVRLDQRGVERLSRMLEEWPESGGSEDEIEPGDWYARLRRFLESNELALTTPLKTGVQVVEAHEAALFPFKHTFVVHANDGEFPRRAPSGVIFSEEERRALAKQGLPLTHRDAWLQRERALWHGVTANPNVTVTYRTADANGVPLLPSLMVPRHAASKEIPRTQYTWPVPFSPIQARCLAAERFAQRKGSREPGSIVVSEPEALRHALLGAYAETQRCEGPECGREAGTLNPWSGELRDRWLLDYLAKRFGPDRVWSASQLEGYAECPFIYLLQRVLHLDELEEAEEETTALTFGGVAHEILERFYPELRKGPFPDTFDERAAELLRDVAARVFAEEEKEEAGWLGLPAYWAVSKRDLVQRLEEYLAWEIPLFGDWRPHLFEYEFGGEEPVEIAGRDLKGRPQKLRVRGYIDRVDVTGEGESATYRILDYKSGRVPAKTHYERGVVQIPIYMTALAEKLGVRVVSGGYRSIKKCTEAAQAEWRDENFDRALGIAFSIPARVRAGKFEAKAAQKWNDYWPGLDVTRVKAEYKQGCRFDE